jgi:hypothetical protein
MIFVDGWVCRACWRPNRPQELACYHCKIPREASPEEIEAKHKADAERAARPEAVPDIVVALPAVVFRVYARVWMRGGIGLGGVLALLVFGGVTDLTWLILTGGVCAGLILFGFMAGEVSDGMREREAWAFIVGLILSVVAVVGSVAAFQVFAPGVGNPSMIRWASLITFGGAGVAAAAGLVLMFTRRDRGI